MELLIEQDLLEGRREDEALLKYLIDAGVEADKAQMVVDTFNEYRKTNRIEEPVNKDVYAWLKRPANEFVDFVRELQDKVSNTQKKKRIKEEGAELIAENEDWIVLHITTYEACCKYGAGSRWCITTENNDHYWKHYTQGGSQFYFLLSKNRPETDKWYKIALQYNNKNSMTFWDAPDKGHKHLPTGLNLPEIPVAGLENNGWEVKPFDYNDKGELERVNLWLIEGNDLIIPRGTKIYSRLDLYTYDDDNDKQPSDKVRYLDSIQLFGECNSIVSIGCGSYSKVACKKIVVGPNIKNLVGISPWGLQSIEFMNKQTEIGRLFSANHDALSWFKIPNTVKTISRGAFSDCDAIDGTYVVSEGVTTLELHSFCLQFGFVRMTLELPSTLTKIDEEAIFGINKVIINNAENVKLYSNSIGHSYTMDGPVEIVLRCKTTHSAEKLKAMYEKYGYTKNFVVKTEVAEGGSPKNFEGNAKLNSLYKDLERFRDKVQDVLEEGDADNYWGADFIKLARLLNPMMAKCERLIDSKYDVNSCMYNLYDNIRTAQTIAEPDEEGRYRPESKRPVKFMRNILEVVRNCMKAIEDAEANGGNE